MVSTSQPPPALRVSSTAYRNGAIHHPRVWQDGYALVLLVSLFCLLGLGVKGISALIMPLRWAILVLFAGAGLFQLQRARTIRATAEHWCLIAMMLVSLTSCLYSADPWYSAQRLVSFVLLWFAVFVGAWAWFSSPRNVLAGANLLYTLACFVTAFSAFHLGQGEILGGERAEGTFGRATGAGAFAALVLPIVIWKIRYSRGWSRHFAVAVLLVQTYLLIFSGARASILAFITGLTVVFWQQYKQHRALMVVGALTLVALSTRGVIGLHQVPDYIVRKGTIGSFTGRTFRWELGWRLFEMRPVGGHGYGMSRYLVFMTPETAQIYADNEPNQGRALSALRAAASGMRFSFNLHSDHVERLVDTGIVGYVFFALFWGIMIHRMRQALRAPRSPHGDLARLLCISVWLILVDSFMHSVLFAVGNGAAAQLWFQLALFAAAVQSATAVSRFRPGFAVPH